MTQSASAAPARHVHLEPIGGAAGDMFVAAMLGLFPDSAAACWQDLHDCGVLVHVNVSLQSGSSHGLAVKRLQVAKNENPAKRTGSYHELKHWLAQSGLHEAVKLRAQDILFSLAQAEGSVHGVDVNDVHFHEVADWDSIVDIVAAASVIERSGVDSWSCGALPLGSGLVQTEHGLLPVPAPATAWLLKDLAVWDDGEPGERVTPTGAAIVRHVLNADHAAPGIDLQRDRTRPPAGVLLAVGCGAGQRDLQYRPNILRSILFDMSDVDGTRAGDGTGQQHEAAAGQVLDEVAQLSFEIDDMTPEELSVSLAHIRTETGALDAGFQLAMGKKGRASFAVVVLCRPEAESAISARCFEETTTLGMRTQRLCRRTLVRHQHLVATAHGNMGIKAVMRPSGTATAKVESDDLASTRGLQARRHLAQRLRKPFES